MENDIQKFPYRKSEVWSPGIDPRMQCSFCDLTGEHFSDSCSVYTDGSVRHNIVAWKGLCDICLDYCSRTGECRTTLRPCWYCVRVKKTCFSDLAKKDYRHHRALCDVPDKRMEARRRIEAAKRELDEVGAGAVDHRGAHRTEAGSVVESTKFRFHYCNFLVD